MAHAQIPCGRTLELTREARVRRKLFGRLVVVAIVLVAAVAVASSLRAQQRGADPNLLRFCPGSGIPCVEITREAYDRGHDQFRSSCGFCHGPTAAGGNGGPNLIFSSVIRQDEKGADITRLIQTGRPEKGMPVVPLTSAQIADIVAYLKARVAEVDLTSGRRPARDYDLKKLLTGNADRGKAYFNGAGQCATCHSADGDLKGIASKYPPIELQARFMYPAGVAKKVTVTEATGVKVTGDLIQQDAFEVVIKPVDGPPRTWPSDSVKVQVTDPLAKHFELLKTYTTANMHDMFAYLATLK
jgi:cytochrome c oxidase cbb3-type subunit 3